MKTLGFDLALIDFDSRWIGGHGIGRFARELRYRLSFGGDVELRVSPANPLDVFFLTIRHLFYRNKIVFSPGYNVPLLGLSRYVFTVHDLNHIEFPGAGGLKRAYYELILKRACRKAARVLTVSEYSKCRIVNWAGISEDRVVNVGNGVGEAFVEEGEAYVADVPYVFIVSNRKAHKNEIRMISAFSRAAISQATKLFISGEPSSDLLGIIKSKGLYERVQFLGSCSDEDLARYYRGASCLLFASLYEGFGLPVVEAMACGTPVITSNVCSLPEVAGDAAVLVNPFDEAEIASALERVINADPELIDGMRRLGLNRARYFTWENVAIRVGKVLSEELAGKCRGKQ